MIFTVDLGDGAPIEFECADTFVSRWVCQSILEGKTYPYLPFVDDVRVVFDVGANCGATSVHLARRLPDAVVHAFEPGTEARAYLERNAARYPNVVVHPFGLGATDLDDVPLYHAADDLGKASVLAREVNTVADSEPIQLRAAGPWLRSQGIERVDILKVDVEGLEVEVLESMADVLPFVKVLYVEYDSRTARRQIMSMVDESHELYLSALMTLDQGECTFVRKDYAEIDAASRWLLDAFVGATTD